MENPAYTIYFGQRDKISFVESYEFFFIKAHSRDAKAYFKEMIVLLHNYERRFLQEMFEPPSYQRFSQTSLFEDFKRRREMVLDVLMYPLRTRLLPQDTLRPCSEIYTEVRHECFERFKIFQQLKAKLVDNGLPEDIVHYLFDEYLNKEK